MTPPKGSAGADEEPDGNDTDRDPVRLGAGTPPAEWAMAGIGALLTAGIIATLVVLGLTETGDPPAFTTRVVEVVEGPGRSRLARVAVTNTGGTAAADVMVEAQSPSGDDLTAVGSAQLDHLPAGSTREVGLFLADGDDPAAVRVEVVGFRFP